MDGSLEMVQKQLDTWYDGDFDAFAKEYFENADRRDKVVCDDAELRACAENVTRKSVRVVRDRADLLPFDINKGTHIAHFVLCNDGASPISRNAAEQLSEKLTQIAASVDTFFDPGPGKARDIAKSGEYQLIVCSVLNEMSYGLNTVKLSGRVARNMMNGWMRLGTPTIFISYYTYSNILLTLLFLIYKF